jgi:hypothetical protein
MTFLRAWGLILIVTVWLCAILLGAAAVLASLACLAPAIAAGKVYVSEMREWREFGHPRNRRRRAGD